MHPIILALLIVGAGAAAFAFWRPRGAFRFAALALVAAIVTPFALAYGLSPFLGSGAGMGVAFLLYALSALLATLAVFAALGAGLRHSWNALR